jgi:uncharacterized protein (TIGR00255 family)
MTSMTGYAYEEKNYESAVVSVEIKSVNSRFLDLTINLPPYLNPLESYFRNKITEKVARGKVDVYIRVKELKSNPDITVDEGAVKAYSEAVKKVIKASGFGTDSEAALNFILSQPGVIVSNRSYDMDKYKALIEPIFDSVLEKFNADRAREGENMKRDLQEKLEKLSKCAQFFTEWQPKMEEMFKEQITTKFRELLEDKADENRIMTETAAMLVKYTINEEIVRLKSHIEAMRTELANNPTPGKKLDFICQEMNREINTIGSKNQFAEVGAMVITAKDSLENIREQSKNVE